MSETDIMERARFMQRQLLNGEVMAYPPHRMFVKLVNGEFQFSTDMHDWRKYNAFYKRPPLIRPEYLERTNT